MATRFIDRQKIGRGLIYFSDGRQIRGKEELGYLKSLGVPPAWRDVKISKSRGARVLATGVDKAGRLQYIYNPTYRARQEREKFERILRFARALPKMRRTTAEHLRRPKLDEKKVLATIVRLMDRAYFRVGNEVYAKENQHYGLTTMRSKHTDVKGDTIIFNYTGKSGQHHLQKITDKRLAKVIRQLDKLPGYEVFKYYDDDGQLHNVDSSDVNEYIKEVMGEEFSAKDFRTWGGTLLATAELAAMERARNVNERKKAVTVCVQKVARRLGNTPAIARASYIDPRIISAYVETNDLAKVRETVQQMDSQSYLSSDEHCVLRLLEKAEAKR